MSKRRAHIPHLRAHDESKHLALVIDGVGDYLTSQRGRSSDPRTSKRRLIAALLGITVAIGLSFTLLFGIGIGIPNCTRWQDGYFCHPEIAYYWGQYSPYFDIRNTDDFKEMKKWKIYPRHDHIPRQCSFTMVSVLSRHGARAPTSHKNDAYNATVAKIREGVQHRRNYEKKYDFLQNYKYDFDADQLNEFGRTQLQHSGRQFWERYKHLIREHVERSKAPFIRAGAQPRVFESAENWRDGLQTEIRKDKKLKKVLIEEDLQYPQPYDILSLPECAACNNTLHHSRCAALESGAYSDFDDRAQHAFTETFAPTIAKRINKDIGLHPSQDSDILINNTDVINLMQLCAFDTLKTPKGNPLSRFCGLFTRDEFHQLDYYESLDKYYSYGGGNPLGPTQGVGWANELIARLTNTPVNDHTSTNTTLDSNPDTFPLPIYNRKTQLYADFTHDNDLVAALSALGLFDDVPTLSTKKRMDVKGTRGFSSSWVCPFAARVYVEKLSCDFSHIDLLRQYRRGTQKRLFKEDAATSTKHVRIIVNDRVMPMPFCQSDSYGLCRLEEFVEAQEFARSGGKWDQCFEEDDTSQVYEGGGIWRVAEGNEVDEEEEAEGEDVKSGAQWVFERATSWWPCRRLW